MKLYEYWGFTTENNPKTNYTIGIDTIENMLTKLKEKPWPIYKIKLGTKDDIKIITELRKHTNAIFRVDANCGWKHGHVNLVTKESGIGKPRQLEPNMHLVVQRYVRPWTHSFEAAGFLLS